MDIINRTFTNELSPINLSTELSHNIEMMNKYYEPTKKESFDDELENIISDKKPLIAHRITFYQKTKAIYLENKVNIINKMLTISIHIFIMIMFEIYFYFNYVIYLEKDEFMKKIKSYLKELNKIQIDSRQKLVISELVMKNSDQVTAQLYDNYIQSLLEQSLLKKKLMIISYKMAGFVGLVCMFFFIAGLLNWRKIKWKTIIIDNMLMFMFLGMFEYFFFSNVILKYNPVTDGEIKYTMYKGIADYINQTNT